MSSFSNRSAHSNLIAASEVHHVENCDLMFSPFHIEEVHAENLVEGVSLGKLSLAPDIRSASRLTDLAVEVMLNIMQDLW